MFDRRKFAIYAWVFLIIMLSVIIFVFPSLMNDRWDLESFRVGFVTPFVLWIPALSTAYKRDRRFNQGDNK